VYANPIARRDVCDFFANAFNATGNLMSKRYRQIVNLGNAVAIMRVGVADPRGGNANQNIRRLDLRNYNVYTFQRPTDLSELYCPHDQSPENSLINE
jgi:hypothetical protein